MKYAYGEPLYKGKRGMSRNSVKALQVDLGVLGYYTMAIDGLYGNGTVNATKDFQRKHGLVVDGKCGINTQSKIKEVLARMGDNKEKETFKSFNANTDRNWRLRSSVSFSKSKVLDVIPSGGLVKVLDEIRGDSYKGTTKWYKVDYKGVIGYCHSYAIREMEDNILISYWLDRQTKVIKFPKSKVEMDLIMGNQPVESVKSVYNRLKEKPLVLMNGGLFGMKGGETLSYSLDEGQIITEGYYDKHALCQYKDGTLKISPMSWMKQIGEIKDIKEAIGGCPTLIYNGKRIMVTTGLDWGFINSKHPRLAVGYDNDYVYVIVVHGRNSLRGWHGCTLGQLQTIGVNLKLDGFINLDGGYSIQIRDKDFTSLDEIPSNRKVDNLLAFYKK